MPSHKTLWDGCDHVDEIAISGDEGCLHDCLIPEWFDSSYLYCSMLTRELATLSSRFEIYWQSGRICQLHRYSDWARYSFNLSIEQGDDSWPCKKNIIPRCYLRKVFSAIGSCEFVLLLYGTALAGVVVNLIEIMKGCVIIVGRWFVPYEMWGRMRGLI